MIFLKNGVGNSSGIGGSVSDDVFSSFRYESVSKIFIIFSIRNLIIRSSFLFDFLEESSFIVVIFDIENLEKILIVEGIERGIVDSIIG